MFSGIVESVQKISAVAPNQDIVRIQIEKPNTFDDLKPGDSVAVNGICLTVEVVNTTSIQFALGAETLHILNTKPATLLGQKVNLERSLRLGDRIHGHLVTGHVDSVGVVTESRGTKESWFLTVECGSKIKPFVWEKGSITLNGVSLTVNKVEGDLISVCLIPETIGRTNLSSLGVGNSINIEVDYFAKAAVQYFASKGMK